ncbi:hypothetical protein RM780_23190 [Streptomyces sp. DSM 44917]|uniref:Lipoprotein n=1 Tax=Streptomyces boetiae TaxID=3075541 RepID=A0ABU2LEZ5_9ACTN|nr:hypothetical protein [Streptomyces sp. DSM 44917]MDT0309838.1 hypothetical protein [Streptomyces sp. DSM 44917]
MSTMTRRLQLAAAAAAGLLALSACSSDGSDEGSSSQDEGAASQGEGGQEGEDGGAGETGEGEQAPDGPLASLPPQEIADRAMEALQSATSLRMRTLGDPGMIGMGLDIHMDRQGSCVGSVTQPGAGSVDVIVREDQEVWMRPDAQFWQSQLAVQDPAVISLLSGRYLHGTTSDPEMQQMAGTCSLAALQADMGYDDRGPGGPDEVGPETDYNGIPVVSINGPDDDGNAASMLVATEGEPYPLLLTRTQSNGTETRIELGQFNEPVEVQEPPADQVLNLADFRTGDIES